jgi:hypothetical protein
MIVAVEIVSGKMKEMKDSASFRSYTLLVKAAPPPRKALQPDHQDDQKEGIEQSKQVF